VSGWISVSERLPDEDEEVLVWCSEAERFDVVWQKYIDVAWQHNGTWYNNQFTYPEVSHWQPLPEPPKVEG
jgi:hypothetical protein